MKSLYELNSEVYNGTLYVDDRVFDFLIKEIGYSRLASVIALGYTPNGTMTKGIQITLLECQKTYNRMGRGSGVPNWFYDKNLQLDLITIIRTDVAE